MTRERKKHIVSGNLSNPFPFCRLRTESTCFEFLATPRGAPTQCYTVARLRIPSSCRDQWIGVRAEVRSRSTSTQQPSMRCALIHFSFSSSGDGLLLQSPVIVHSLTESRAKFGSFLFLRFIVSGDVSQIVKIMRGLLSSNKLLLRS